MKYETGGIASLHSPTVVIDGFASGDVKKARIIVPEVCHICGDYPRDAVRGDGVLDAWVARHIAFNESIPITTGRARPDNLGAYLRFKDDLYPQSLAASSKQSLVAAMRAGDPLFTEIDRGSKMVICIRHGLQHNPHDDDYFSAICKLTRLLAKGYREVVAKYPV